MAHIAQLISSPSTILKEHRNICFFIFSIILCQTTNCRSWDRIGRWKAMRIIASNLQWLTLIGYFGPEWRMKAWKKSFRQAEREIAHAGFPYSLGPKLTQRLSCIKENVRAEGKVGVSSTNIGSSRRPGAPSSHLPGFCIKSMSAKKYKQFANKKSTPVVWIPSRISHSLLVDNGGSFVLFTTTHRLMDRVSH